MYPFLLRRNASVFIHLANLAYTRTYGIAERAVREAQSLAVPQKSLAAQLLCALSGGFGM